MILWLSCSGEWRYVLRLRDFLRLTEIQNASNSFKEQPAAQEDINQHVVCEWVGMIRSTRKGAFDWLPSSDRYSNRLRAAKNICPGLTVFTK